MTHAEIAELLGAYALDAVSPDEAAEIEEHLAECPRCRAEVSAHREVAGVLGNLSGTAPAGLWGRIADELALSSGGPSVAGSQDIPAIGRPAFGDLNPSGDSEAGEDLDSPEAVAKAPAPVISIDSVRPPRAGRPEGADGSGLAMTGRRRKVLFSSVAALAAALAIVVGVLASRVVNLDNRVSALTTAVITGGIKAQVAAAELDPSHVDVALTSAKGWSAKVVALPGGQAFLVPGKMPAIAADQTFQAWALVRGSYVSLGVLGRTPGDVVLQLQPGMSAVLVNTEPQGGSSHPTTAPFVAGSIPKTL